MDEKEAEARPLMGTIFLVIVSLLLWLSVYSKIAVNKCGMHGCC